MIIKGILFDFDGTLTVPGAINFLEIKASLGCPSEIPILEFIESLDKDKQQKAYSLLDRHEEKAAKISFPAQGAESLITVFKKKRLPLGIITRNSRNAVSTKSFLVLMFSAYLKASATNESSNTIFVRMIHSYMCTIIHLFSLVNTLIAARSVRPALV